MHCLTINFKQKNCQSTRKTAVLLSSQIQEDSSPREKKADFGPENLTEKLKFLPLFGIKFTPSITNKTRVRQNPVFKKKPAGRFFNRF